MIQAFKAFDGLVAPMNRANIDTDAIIPKQFMKSICRTGFGVNLFDEWRYLDHGEPGQDCRTRSMNPEFVLNEPRYKGAQILLARDNFGCGSSREHAAWALADYGFRALLAPSFADIFYGNCLKNGVLPIILDKPTVEELFEAVRNTPGYQVSVDLDAQTVTLPEGHVVSFAIEPSRKTYLLDGLDDIAITLQQVELIRSYERQRQACEPWLFE